MPKQTNRKEIEQLKLRVGARLKEIRTTALKVSQDKLGEDAPYIEGNKNNLQVKIAALERGNGSTATIYTVLQHMYDKGININYLFGEEETMQRISRQVSLYPENIIDYLQDVLVSSGKVRAIVNDIMESTKRVENYVEKAVEIAEMDSSADNAALEGGQE